MAVHTHAHHQGARSGPGRKSIKQLTERRRALIRVCTYKKGLRALKLSL